MSDSHGRGTAQERRTRFRVADQVLLVYEPMDERQAAERRQSLQGPLPGAFALASELQGMSRASAELRRQAAQEASAVAQLIDVLDRKIQRVTEVLMALDLGDSRPERLDVDLSPDGMGFRVSGPLPVGTMLDLRVLMPSTGLGLRTFARVIHCGERRDGTLRMGVQFEFLHEHDRDLMADHVSQRESLAPPDRHQQEP